MIVTIHQPEHLPWLGFFAKMAAAELFVSLDSVPYRKNYFQNRNRILGYAGAPAWLTVPVRLNGHLQGNIAGTPIAADTGWKRKYLRTLEQRYSRHPGFEVLFPALCERIEGAGDELAELNESLIALLREHLSIETPVVRASDVGGCGSRSELLADLCDRVGADVYLSGPSGRDYLDPVPFGRVGVEVRVHDYEHPEYEQRGASSFVSHLSIVDLLFNTGPAAADIVRSGSRIGELR